MGSGVKGLEDYAPRKSAQVMNVTSAAQRRRDL